MSLSLPIAKWLPAYGLSEAKGDLISGLTVGVMLVPQGMAYAMLAGVPPVYGLYASLVPLVLYTILGTSKHLAVGIMAIDCLIVAAVVGTIATPGTPEFLELVILLAGLTGLIQLTLSLMRFGFIVALLSRPVIAGFASAAALTIGLSQVPGLLGSAYAGSPGAVNMALNAGALIAGLQPESFLIGLGSILLLLLIKRRYPSIPGSLMVVILGTLAVWGFQLDLSGVSIVGDIPSGLPSFALPAATSARIITLLPTALALALIQFTTVVSLGKVFAARHRYQIDANKELWALGAINFLGSLFQSLPVSGSFSRSAVAESSGAASPASNLVAASLVGIILLFLTPAFYYLPIPAFAAIIMVAAFGMVDIKEIRLLLKTKKVDGWIALVTFAATLFIGIQEGILVGIGASITAIMFRITRPNVVELGHLPGSRLYRELARTPEARRIPGLFILRFDASYNFANADFIRDEILRRAEDEHKIDAVLVDATSINDLDMTAVEVLTRLFETLSTRDIRLIFYGVKGRVGDVLDAAGLTALMSGDSTFMSAHRAVMDVLEKQGLDESFLDTLGGDSAT
ncbi:sulfate permease [Rhodothermus sp. AH-315-K08]|nr:sulfate permease [Rhodothermus sp. AH-315-K08]